MCDECDKLRSELDAAKAEHTTLLAGYEQKQKALDALKSDNAALVKALDEATLVGTRTIVENKYFNDARVSSTAGGFYDVSRTVIERDYSRLSPASRALCERLFKEE